MCFYQQENRIKCFLFAILLQMFINESVPAITHTTTEPASDGCVLPVLQNLIVKTADDQVIPAGQKIANGSKIFYSCQTHHKLHGETENSCRMHAWVNEFPYCELHDEHLLARVIAIFAICFTVIILLSYCARKAGQLKRKRRAHNHWLEATPRSSTSTLPVTAL